MNVRFVIAWLYYSRFFFSWEEGGGGERTPVPGMLSGMRSCWTDAGKACAVDLSNCSGIFEILCDIFKMYKEYGL